MNTPSAPAGPHPSRLAVSEYLSGEAAPAERAALEAHAAACGECAATLRSAMEARDAFAAKYPSLGYLAATRRARRAAAPAPGFLDRWRAFWAAPGRPALATATLVLAAVVLLRLAWQPAPADLSAKGAAKAILSVNGRPVPGDTLACKPGDTLQLGIVSEHPVHFAVLYRDDEGPLQVYMDEGRGAPRGNPAGEPLPHSLILDAGWARERLYCVWSPEPFDAQAARDRAEGKPGGPPGLRVFLLRNSP